jgi:hypothetical protein
LERDIFVPTHLAKWGTNGVEKKMAAGEFPVSSSITIISGYHATEQHGAAAAASRSYVEWQKQQLYTWTSSSSSSSSSSGTSTRTGNIN